MSDTECRQQSETDDAIIIPRELLDDMVAFLRQFRDEVAILRDDYETLRDLVEVASRWRDSDGTLICDGCGLLYPDDDRSNEESCDRCGRIKQQMESAIVTRG